METLSGGLLRWSYSDAKPPTLDVRNAIGYAFLGLHEVGSTWFLPANLAAIMDQPGKGNVLVDALSRSKRVEPNAVLNTVEESGQAKEIAMMTRLSLVATKEVKI